MKVKTAELEGTALDWAVAKCECHDVYIPAFASQPWLQIRDKHGLIHHCPKYITDWAHGGPIIERIKGFQFKQWLESQPDTCCEAHIHNYVGDWIAFGPTLLIAAMRCYVASRLGDAIEVPDELMACSNREADVSRDQANAQRPRSRA